MPSLRIEATPELAKLMRDNFDRYPYSEDMVRLANGEGVFRGSVSQAQDIVEDVYALMNESLELGNSTADVGRFSSSFCISGRGGGSGILSLDGAGGYVHDQREGRRLCIQRDVGMPPGDLMAIA